jgi:hemerythrin
MIKWQDSYKTGVEKLDSQHRRLFEIANEAYELLKKRSQGGQVR